MATYTVGAGDYIRPHRNARIRPMPEAVSQTFLVGDPLIKNTTANKGNECKISGGDPGAGTVVGVAMQAASGTTGTEVPIAVLDEQAEFVIRVADTQALDNDDIGVEYGIVADSTNDIWRLDTDETTAKVFRVVDFAPNPATGAKFVHGDVNGAYLVTAAAGVQGLLRK